MPKNVNQACNINPVSKRLDSLLDLDKKLVNKKKSVYNPKLEFELNHKVKQILKNKEKVLTGAALD